MTATLEKIHAKLAKAEKQAVRYDPTEHSRVEALRKATHDLMEQVKFVAEHCQPSIETRLMEYHDALDAALADELTGNALDAIENAEAEALSYGETPAGADQ